MDGLCEHCGSFFEAASLSEWNFRQQHPRAGQFQTAPVESAPPLRIRSLQRVRPEATTTAATTSDSGSPPTGHPWLADRAAGQALANAALRRPTGAMGSPGVGYSHLHDVQGNEVHGAEGRNPSLSASLEHARLIEQVLASIHFSRPGQQVVVVRRGTGGLTDTLSYEEAIAIQEQLGSVTNQGMTPEAIERIQIQPIVGECMCAVCMEDFVEGEPARKLPCAHLFHARCIDPWLAIKPLCPLCKQPMDRE